MTKHEIISEVTRAVREADAQFETVGGSSRHWVRDCFLPALERHGLFIIRLTPVAVDGASRAEIESPAAADRAATEL